LATGQLFALEEDLPGLITAANSATSPRGRL
jgi:hypothetical protein